MKSRLSVSSPRLLASAAIASIVVTLIAVAGDKPAASVVTTKPQNLSKMTKEELRKQLTPMQYKVACESGTEPPFRNEFWDNHADGIYLDVISGEPLFASVHKFDSGTGWPSFWQPLKKSAILEKVDNELGAPRTEVRGAQGDSHLGHVFADGPKPTGLRYCINSASLRFVPKEKLQELGYGEFLALFEKPKKN